MSNKRKFLSTVIVVMILISCANTNVFVATDNHNDISVKQVAENFKTVSSEYDTANSEYTSLISEKQKTESEIRQLEKEIGNLDLKNNDSALDNKKDELDTLARTIEQQQNKLGIYQNELSKATDKYNEGSFGFFEYVGANDAINALKNCQYASYTNQGLETDATNLENMKATFDFIRECNDLRKNEGVDPTNNEKLGELKVNDYMMATAQADANYSLTNIEHAHQFNIGENLAWGYKDPFTGWYDREKAKYLSGITEFHVVGHYLNIVDSTYYVTGFAIAQGGLYGIEHAQTFLYYTGSSAMSVDEYEARFNVYYNKVTSDVANAKSMCESAQNELNALNNQKNKLQSQYDNLYYENERIRNELKQKNLELSDTKNSLLSLDEKITVKKVEVEKKYSSYKQVKVIYDKAINDNKGDTNYDESTDIADALMIARYDAELIQLDETQILLSDVNKDDSVDIADALMIARYDAGLISSL